MAADDEELVTPDYVAARLEEAAKTMKRMPMPRNARPGTYRCNYPEVVQGYWEFWNRFASVLGDEDLESKHLMNEAEEERNRIRTPPSAKAIDSMDRCLMWLHWIEHRDRKVVWAHAGGISFRQLRGWDGRSHETLRRVWQNACERIAVALNKHGPDVYSTRPSQKNI